jgi:Mrp family chromosome partitioning ATPase/capsular polysaccharide biosynthesis protein
MTTSSASRGREPAAEERIDVRRYLDALRRSRRLIAGIVVLMTGTVLAVSLLLPDTYRATTRIVFEDSATVFGETNPESTQRRLATIETLVTAPTVLNSVAREVGESRDSLEDNVEASVDEEANIVNVSATDEDPRRAARIANSVAREFLSQRAALERERIRRARENLEQQIAGLEAQPNAGVQVGAIRERISELTVSEGSAGSDLQIAERAEVPDAPASPRPLRNTILALFGSLFIAVLVALARDQLVPRVSGPRELGRLLDLPVLAGVPYVRGSGRKARFMSGVEAEAYQTLQAAITLALRGEDKRLILVTGAVHAEGKSTATARLGRAIARAGHRTLLVSADLRVPRLHGILGVPLGIGVGDVLSLIDWEKGGFDGDLRQEAIQPVIVPSPGKGGAGSLDVITSGTPIKDPGRLATGPAMAVFLDEVRRLDYDVVLIDAPPLLGIADSQVVSRHVDALLLVTRLDRITLEHVNELRETLDRIEVRPLGLVVIGARSETSPYYMARRPLIEQAEV